MRGARLQGEGRLQGRRLHLRPALRRRAPRRAPPRPRPPPPARRLRRGRQAQDHRAPPRRRRGPLPPRHRLRRLQDPVPRVRRADPPQAPAGPRLARKLR
uniref:Uncharacterized protein n=1 Tax=Arundo donax TaxID=35708 RepID=A0A0A9E726_ARUDO